MKVKDYAYHKIRKTATIWLEDITPDELRGVLIHLEVEKKKKSNDLPDHDQIMLDIIKEVS